MLNDILFKARENIDNGEHISTLTFPSNYDFNNLSLDDRFISTSSSDNDVSSDTSSESENSTF